MYTQCSTCETVFKLSADVLRAAGGQVRCGKCGEVFNALARLAEDAGAFQVGESPLELETRADSILESMPALPVAMAMARDAEEYDPPGVEIAHLRFLDLDEDAVPEGLRGSEASSDLANESSLEFTLPPGELDRIFVESKKRTRMPDSAPASPAPGSMRAPIARTAPRTAPPPEPDSREEPPPDPPPHPESVPFVDRRVRNAAGGLEVSEEVRREVLEGLEHAAPAAGSAQRTPGRGARAATPLDAENFGDELRGAPRRSVLLWLGAAAASALLLAGQIVHQNREWLSSHPPFAAVVRGLYASLGGATPAPANLSAYQLRQWGVTGDPSATGTLRVRASILNTAAHLQPFPLLRVTLANRFGARIGSRDFEPSEYLGKPIVRLLAPGERADATLDILDPGKSAEGFEIDVCLRQSDQKVACASDAAPQTKQ